MLTQGDRRAGRGLVRELVRELGSRRQPAVLSPLGFTRKRTQLIWLSSVE